MLAATSGGEALGTAPVSPEHPTLRGSSSKQAPSVLPAFPGQPESRRGAVAGTPPGLPPLPELQQPRIFLPLHSKRGKKGKLWSCSSCRGPGLGRSLPLTSQGHRAHEGPGWALPWLPVEWVIPQKCGIIALLLVGVGLALGPLLLIKVIIHLNVLLLASSVLSY